MNKPESYPLSSRRRSLVVSMLLALVLGLCASYQPDRVAARAAGVGGAKVGRDVVEALRSRGSARVMIALAAPMAAEAARPDLPAVRRGVARSQDAVLAAVTIAEFQSRRRFEAIPALAGTIRSEAGLARLAAHPQVARIDLDVGGGGSLATSVPLIGASTWQGHGVTGEGVVVAVIDSGMDSDHDDLADSLIHQECFLDHDGSIDGSGLCPNGSDRQSGAGAAEDDAGHGTHVTGIIAANGVHSSVGVAPDAQIVSIKVTAGPSFGGVFFYFSEVVAAFDYIINQRPDVKIINMSIGTNAQFQGDCDNSTAYNMAGAAAINTLRDRGVIAFASAGNEGSGTEMKSPACLSNVIAVGATDNADKVAGFSNSNAATDVFAPGVGIVAAGLNNGTATASGTSMASPHAAGCAALFLEAGAASTPDEIETLLETSAVQVTDPTNSLVFPRISCAPRPPTGVVIDGPVAGAVGVDYAFVAAVGPSTTTVPVEYSWQLDGQPIATNSGDLTDTITFRWTAPGTYIVTVTATNVAGSVSDSHTVLVDHLVHLPLIAK